MADGGSDSGLRGHLPFHVETTIADRRTRRLLIFALNSLPFRLPSEGERHVRQQFNLIS